MSMHMKKSFLVVGLGLTVLLGSCGASTTAASTTSSGDVTGGNTITSVLSSFGQNLTANASFDFLSNGGSAPSFVSTYIKQGCHFQYNNFGTEKTNGGFVYVKDGKKEGVAAGYYKYVDAATSITLGEALSADWRTLYHDPSEIGAAASTYAAAFKAQIANATSGFFDLNNDKDESGNRTYPHADLLNALAKSLGVYDTITSVTTESGEKVSLDYATLYFSDKGTNFTFTFYAKDGANGYAGLKTIVAVNTVGATEISTINEYFAPSTLDVTPTAVSLTMGGAASSVAVTTDAGALITATTSKPYFTLSVSGTTVTLTPIAATDPNNPFTGTETATKKNATLTIRSSDADGFYREVTVRVTFNKA